MDVQFLGGRGSKITQKSVRPLYMSLNDHFWKLFPHRLQGEKLALGKK